MIAKKNSKLDLEGKRRAFFTLGLLVTGSLTLAAFTYSDPMMNENLGKDVVRERITTTYEIQEPDKKKDIDTFDDQDKNDDNSQQTIDIQQHISQLITRTVNTSKVITGVTVDLGGMPTGPKTTKGTKVAVDPGTIEEWVDQEAEFIGGFIEMSKFIQKEMDYPEMSVQAGEEGKVFVSFVVEKSGRISNVKVEQGVSRALDREAKRVVASFPNWIPGEIGAKKVRTRVRIPIVFTLK